MHLKNSRKWHRMNDAEMGQAKSAHLEKKMNAHARNLEFEEAAAVRDEIRMMREEAMST